MAAWRSHHRRFRGKFFIDPAKSKRRPTSPGCLPWHEPTRLLGRLAGTAVLTILSAFGPAALAQSKINPIDQQVYERAISATTLAEFDHVLTELESLRSQAEATEASRNYFTRLQAWTLNRRGETRVKRAAELATGGKVTEARQLDRLALADFEASIRLDPQRWKSLHNRGICLALAGKFAESLSDFSRTIELRPEYADAWFNRGEIRYEMGKFRAAIEDYERAIELRPEDAGFLTSRGHAYFQLRQFQAALSDYRRAVELAPEQARSYVNRGNAQRALGNWGVAANDFRKAISLDSQHADAYQSAAWLMATCPEPQYRDTSLAVRAARKALELAGQEDYILLDTLAASLASDGQFDEASQTEGQAIAKAPPENVEPLRARLELFKRHRAFRQSAARVAEK